VKIDYEFTVGVPVDQAWGRMLDLEKIAPCLPGAAIQEEMADGEYAGTIKVEIGPITVGYKGTVKFEETNESAHRAVLQATGRETRGQGTASATIVSTLREEGEGTRVNVETDLLLTGRVAQFGRGIAQGVATEMLDEFAACLEREISGAAESADDGKAAPAARAAGAISNAEAPRRGRGRDSRGRDRRRFEPLRGGRWRPDHPHATADGSVDSPPRAPGAIRALRPRRSGPGRDAGTSYPRAHRRRGPARPSLALPQEALERPGISPSASRRQTVARGDSASPQKHLGRARESSPNPARRPPPCQKLKAKS
jgi:carbon monoxide dehydrogenase subunit G